MFKVLLNRNINISIDIFIRYKVYSLGLKRFKEGKSTKVVKFSKVLRAERKAN